MAQKSTPVPRWQRRKQARPEEIVAAALELFSAKGYSATRLEEVAHAAGVSKGTVYLYFSSKQELFEAVIRQVVIPTLERAEQQVAQHQGSASELLHLLVKQWWQTIGETTLCGIPKLIMAEAGNFPDMAQFFVMHVVRRSRALFVKVIERGIANGEFRRCNAIYCARILMTPMVFATIWKRSLEPYDKEDYAVDKYLETHLELFLRGISAATDG